MREGAGTDAAWGGDDGVGADGGRGKARGGGGGPAEEAFVLSLDELLEDDLELEDEDEDVSQRGRPSAVSPTRTPPHPRRHACAEPPTRVPSRAERTSAWCVMRCRKR